MQLQLNQSVLSMGLGSKDAKIIHGPCCKGLTSRFSGKQSAGGEATKAEAQVSCSHCIAAHSAASLSAQKNRFY